MESIHSANSSIIQNHGKDDAIQAINPYRECMGLSQQACSLYANPRERHVCEKAIEQAVNIDELFFPDTLAWIKIFPKSYLAGFSASTENCQKAMQENENKHVK